MSGRRSFASFCDNETWIDRGTQVIYGRAARPSYAPWGLGTSFGTLRASVARSRSRQARPVSDKCPICKSLWRWRDPDSNRGHHDFQSCALPTELSRRDGLIRVSRASVPAVLRRRAPLLLAALALLGAVVAAVVLLRGGDDRPKRAVRAEPLAFVPAGTADVVFDLDTPEPLVALGVEQLAQRVTHGGLSAEQAHALVGGRAAVAIDAGKAWLAFATDAPAPRPTNGAAAAARGGVVLVAPSPAALATAEAGARAPSARYARATFDKRFVGLPAAAGARVAFDPKPLLAQRSPQAADTAWGRSLRDGAAVLTTSGPEVRVPFRITADP